MKKVLVDTSVWIEFFGKKSSKADPLSQLVAEDLVCVNRLVLAELIPSLEQARELVLIGLLKKVRTVDAPIDWDRIMRMQALNYKHGINKVGIPDLIILDSVIQHNLSLFSLDKHFVLMRRHTAFSIFEN